MNLNSGMKFFQTFFGVCRYGLFSRKARSKLRFRKLLVCVLALALVFNGCATMRLPEHEAQSFDHYKNAQVKSELAVAIQPLTDVKDIKEYFGTNLLSMNVLPIFIAAENRGSASSFILSKDRFTMGAAQSAHNNLNQAGSGRESAGQSVAIVGAALISMPMLFAAMKMISDSTVIQHNLKVKEFQTNTLSPGEKVQGFAYFQLPDKKTRPNEWNLHLEALETRSKKTEGFDFTFALEGKGGNQK